MMLPKFTATSVLKSGYNVTFADDNVDTELKGPSRSRADFIGSPHSVAASWYFNAETYDYFYTYFYRVLLGGGTGWFLIDLRIDSLDLLEYEAKIVSGSLSAPEHTPKGLKITATLEVKQQKLDVEYVSLRGFVFEEFDGPFVNLLDDLVNVQIPQANL